MPEGLPRWLNQPERVSVRFLCEPWANAQRLIYPT